MTWWAPLDVLRFAREAGWDNDQGKRAATVALVATSGADHYLWDTPGVPGSDMVGLWGLPLSDVQSVGGGDQMSPRESAQTARALWIANGRKWEWHPVVQSDAGATVRRTLDALDLDNLWGASAKQAYGQLHSLRKFLYQSKRTRAIMAKFPTS